MDTQKNTRPNCVVRNDSAAGSKADQAALDMELQDCMVIEPIRKLLALGLSTKDIEQLDITQTTLQSICEYARLDDSDRDSNEKAIDAISTTLDTISNQIGNLELEMKMLLLRKNALQRRKKVLGRLSAALKQSAPDHL